MEFCLFVSLLNAEVYNLQIALKNREIYYDTLTQCDKILMLSTFYHQGWRRFCQILECTPNDIFDCFEVNKK